MFTPLEAFVAVVLLDGNIAYDFNTAAFNHHILELPFFALAGWSLYRAFVGNALRDWLLVGLWFALAFYTKYQAFVLLLPVLAFAVVDPHARQCWRKPGPYVAAVVSAVLCAPQFLWMALVDHFGPIKFAEGKAESALSLFDLLWSTLKFIVNGLFYIIPVADAVPSPDGTGGPEQAAAERPLRSVRAALPRLPRVRSFGDAAFS